MSGEQKLDRSVLEGKKADELRAIAAATGVPLAGRPTKAGMIDQILQTATGGAAPGRRSSRNNSNSDSTGGAVTAVSTGEKSENDASQNGEAPAAVAGAGSSSEPTVDVTTSGTSEASTAGEGGQRQGRNNNDRQSRNRNGGFDNYAADSGQGAGRNSRRRRGRNRNGGGANGGANRGERNVEYDRNVEAAAETFQGDPIPVTGILELRDEGFGFLRTKGMLATSGDVYVPVSQVRKYGLRKGDSIEGTSRPAASNEKYPALLAVDKIGGLDPELAKHRPRFEDLTPLFPDSKLSLETPGDPTNLTARIVDLLAPIGKGQRGLIVSPPKAGKTTVMKQIAHSMEANNPDVHLMVLLVDERPEEVTDMRRSVKGEVIASTFDRPAEEHTKVAELAIERAKRLVESGIDVVIILDGITRLARAYNLAAPASGRILSGGVDSGALYPPKKFFGSARNIEEGGSLTILATALVETGSKMDEVIFEEFKGTGNMELRLDRRLAERRLYPAIDANASSTRHEELLFERVQLQQVWKLRRVLNALASDGNTASGLELLMDKIKTTKSNDEFLAEIAKNPVPGA